MPRYGINAGYLRKHKFNTYITIYTLKKIDPTGGERPVFARLPSASVVESFEYNFTETATSTNARSHYKQDTRDYVLVVTHFIN